MKLQANMDLLTASYSIEHTTSAAGICLPFRCQTIGYFLAGSKYFTDRSELPTFFAGYGVSGSGILRYRSREYRVAAGDVFFISCEEHQYYATDEAPCEFRWMHFNGVGCDSLFRIFENRPFVFPAALEMKMKQRFVFLESQMRQSTLESDLLLSEAVGSLLYELCRKQLGLFGASRQPEDCSGIAAAAAYIQLHFCEPLSVTELAQQSHLSKFYFIRLFRQNFGCTPYQFVIQKRLEEAKRLLHNAGLTVEEIAYHVGYGNPSNLIRDFRKNTGMTPGSYRLLETTFSE